LNEIPESADQAAAGWLLGFTAADPHSPAGDGRPWGDGTAMAARAYAGVPPWDTGNAVTPMVGGFATMNAIRDAFESAIDEANALAANGKPPGQRGHVYIADWQFNALRDTSTTNPWGNSPWNPDNTVGKDQTALGLVVRMMSAGIVARLLLWMPTAIQRKSVTNLADEHYAVAAAVQDHNATLQRLWQLSQPIGVVALDLRVAAPALAVLHQKEVVVRVGAVNVAFCGGVDLAFTRRDFGLGPGMSIGSGDWQSGDTLPLSGGWPKQSPPPYGGYPAYPYPGSPLAGNGSCPENLPATVFGSGNQHWHDHHLQLQGPIVATLEQQFAERWIRDCNGRACVFDRDAAIGGGDQVKLTSAAAISDGKVEPLPPAEPVAPAGTATVQMWRTIPLCPGISAGPFVRGEFTVMAGLANAVSQATELITIWDQCFWNEPLARLLAARLTANPGLRLLIVIPPYGNDADLIKMEMTLRKNALQDLWRGLDSHGRSRVAVRDMWAQAPNVGVYVHAKTQTYDDQLLVCGSANLNRRSMECDAELDCAVLHPPTLRAHLANLYSCVTGQTWSDFSPGWLTQYWTGLVTGGARALIKDPFFAETIGNPTTPNGVPMPYSSPQQVPAEPTSIGPPVESGTGQFPDCAGDPKAPGRLDEITFLLERCHQGTHWPWRQPATCPAAKGPEPGQEGAAQPRRPTQ
jgi:phosphatidylserine/phosphatidylglycerophosphate/cardiolipin synthase-like enzyme